MLFQRTRVSIPVFEPAPRLWKLSRASSCPNTLHPAELLLAAKVRAGSAGDVRLTDVLQAFGPQNQTKRLASSPILPISKQYVSSNAMNSY